MTNSTPRPTMCKQFRTDHDSMDVSVVSAPDRPTVFTAGASSSGDAFFGGPHLPGSQVA